MFFGDLYVGPALVVGLLMTGLFAIYRVFELTAELKQVEKAKKIAEKEKQALLLAAITKKKTKKVPFYTKSFSETEPGTLIKFH